MSRRMWVVAALSWVAVVLAGSALTWLAITRAGDQVSSTADSGSPEPVVVVGTIDTPPSVKTPHPRAAKPKPSVTPRPSPSSAPASSAPAPPSAGPQRPAPSTPRNPPPSRTVTRTWAGAPGFVTASCTGSTARLQAASPNTGWSVERGDESGDHIQVKFYRSDAEVQVEALCVGGVPQFRAETSGDGSAASGGDSGG